MVLEQLICKQMPLSNTHPHPPRTHPPDVVFTVMVQVTPIAQHSKVSWVVVRVVLVKVSHGKDDAVARNRVGVFVGSPAPFTAPVVASFAQIV